MTGAGNGLRPVEDSAAIGNATAVTESTRCAGPSLARSRPTPSRRGALRGDDFLRGVGETRRPAALGLTCRADEPAVVARGLRRYREGDQRGAAGAASITAITPREAPVFSTPQARNDERKPCRGGDAEGLERQAQPGVGARPAGYQRGEHPAGLSGAGLAQEGDGAVRVGARCVRPAFMPAVGIVRLAASRSMSSQHARRASPGRTARSTESSKPRRIAGTRLEPRTYAANTGPRPFRHVAESTA